MNVLMLCKKQLVLKIQKVFVFAMHLSTFIDAPKKHTSPVEDVKKAIWYLEKFLQLEGEENENN